MSRVISVALIALICIWVAWDWKNAEELREACLRRGGVFLVNGGGTCVKGG